jgi:hypothetical protein
MSDELKRIETAVSDELKRIETAVMQEALSRTGQRRYLNGDPLELNPSDLRDIVRLTMEQCRAAPSAEAAPVAEGELPPLPKPPDGYVAMTPEGSVFVPPTEYRAANCYTVYSAEQVRQAQRAAIADDRARQNHAVIAFLEDRLDVRSELIEDMRAFLAAPTLGSAPQTNNAPAQEIHCSLGTHYVLGTRDRIGPCDCAPQEQAERAEVRCKFDGNGCGPVGPYCSKCDLGKPRKVE